MNGSRILIVEDEAGLMRGLRDAFAAQGCVVLSAVDGEAGMDLALGGSPDLIVLDIMLPKINGYEICQAVRARGVDVPIIMLTARGQEEDIVRGLNSGADDYVTKPFGIRELIARVNAFLRRRNAGRESVCRFGDFVLDIGAHKLFRNGEEVELTSKEFRLLAHLASRPGRALTRDDILDAVWGSSVFVTPRSIDRCVTTLRGKIERDSRSPRHVQTIRDIGYRFEPD